MTLPIPDPIDIAYYGAKDLHPGSNAGHLIQRAHELAITGPETAGVAAECAKTLHKMAGEIEKRRKEMVAPFNQGVRQINAMASEAARPLVEAETHLRDKLSVWQRAEAKRIAAEAEAAREAEALALSAAANAAASGDAETAEDIAEAVGQMPDPAALAQMKPVARGDFGAVASTRKGWAFEVNDPDQVPREYLTIDERKVKAAIAGGVREIPGLVIFETATLVIK